MRFLILLPVWLYSIALLGQTPSINYYGEPSVGQFVSEFISLGNGAYHIFGNGYFNGHSDSDIFVFSFYENGGPFALTTSTEEKSQSVQYVESMPDNGYVMCSYTTVADQIFGDIKLTIYEADGTVVNSTLISSPYVDSVLRFQVDENGNIYLIVRQGTNAHNISTSREFLMKYDADLTEVYVEEFLDENAEIASITVLPNNQVVMFSSDYDGVVTGRVFSENGEIEWNQVYSVEPSGDLEGAKSLFDGTNIELLLPRSEAVWTIDVSDGSIINEADLPLGLPFIFSTTRFLQHGDSFWIVYFSDILKFSRDGNLLVLEEEYPLPNGSIAELHPDGENAIMLLTYSGELTRFDFVSGVFTTIGGIELMEAESLSERVERLDVTGSGIRLGLSHNAGFDPQFSLADVTAAGELIEKVIIEPEFEISSYEMLSVANDKISLISFYAGEGMVSFWNTDGSLRSTVVLSDSDDGFINLVDGVTLDDGRLIGICFYGGFIRFYEIDPVNETVIEVGEMPYPFSITPGYIHALEGDHIGFVERTSGSPFRVLKVNTAGDLIWENTLQLDEEVLRSTPPYSEWIVNSTVDNYVVGTVTRGTDIIPAYYEVKVLDIDGSLMQEFRSENSFIDATPIFANDDEVIVIGTDYNLDNQTDGEQYLLYYQRYDLMGNLLAERIHEMPYLMYVHQLEFLPNGNLALMGRATINSSIDAMLVIMDDEGFITKTTTLVSAWGELQLGPNPGRDHLQLQLENEYKGTLQISLLDNKGQQLRNWTANKSTSSFIWQQTLQDIPAGTYWVNISSPDGQITKAWVKQ